MQIPRPSSERDVDDFAVKKSNLRNYLEFCLEVVRSRKASSNMQAFDGVKLSYCNFGPMLAERARVKVETWLASDEPFTKLQWDELMTFEHTRLNRLSVPVMVCEQHRRILGFRVAQIPASGLIAQRSREKYGPRRNLSGYARRDLLKSLAPHIASQATVTCDEHPRYREELEAALTDVNVIQYHSVRGSLTGQGELKRTGLDSLFTVNHTLAMLRDNIKRLTRRTWCTTKRQSALEDVIAIYIHFHNSRLIP